MVTYSSQCPLLLYRKLLTTDEVIEALEACGGMDIQVSRSCNSEKSRGVGPISALVSGVCGRSVPHCCRLPL